MNYAPQTIPGPKEVARLLFVYAPRWAVPALLIAAVAVTYAAFRRPKWEASQALIVRNEATANEESPGKFRELNEMKTVQELILELAVSRGVLGAALSQLGPPAGYANDRSAWPAPRDVAALRRQVTVRPPKGAEFGKTEVFYLKVKDHDRQRAVALNDAICNVLQTRFQQLRDIRAQSMIDELGETVRLARADLAASTCRLTETEKAVGGDLAELRALGELASGDTALQRTAAEIRSELRRIRDNRRTNEQLLAMLRDAQGDPGRLVVTPGRLLQSHPALRRLKDGLLDAQLNTASLQGRMSSVHPLVRAAKEAEMEIGRNLHDELPIAVRGLEAELQMDRRRESLLEAQLAKDTERLARLAELRAGYANQVAATANCTDLVKRAGENLAEARAAHASAKAATLISRIDSPDAGIHPLGPGRSMIALAGIAGGLLAGLGVLFLTVPLPAPAVPAAAADADDTDTVVTDSRPPVRQVAPAELPRPAMSLKEALEKIVCGNAV